MDENQRNFTGVFIPAEIYKNQKLSWTDKVLWGTIKELTNNKSCQASNCFLAQCLKISETNISKSISKLKKLGFVTQKSFDGRVRELVVNLIPAYETEGE